MGKTKQKKFRAPKPKPTGLPSVKDCEKEFEEGLLVEPSASCSNGSVDESTLNIFEKLGSPNEEDREWGCTSVASLVSQPANISVLLENNVVKILGPLILDNSLQVRHKALGALRNLSVDGGVEACEEMIRRDILTPLVALFQQYGQGWLPEQPTGKRKVQLKSDIFTEATHVLWNLCEASEEAVNAFNKENLISYLWPCLQHSVYGLPLAITVAQCLHTVTEDNNELKNVCKERALTELQSLMSAPTDTPELVLLKTLHTGIVVNLYGTELSTAPGNVVSAIISSVSDVLAIDAVSALQSSINELQEDIKRSLEGGQTEQKEKVLMETENNNFSEKASNIKNILAAQQVSLEIITNLCCSDDDEWEDMNSSESSSDEINQDIEMEDEPCVNNFISPLCVPSEIHSSIVKNDIFTKVLNKSQPLDMTQLNFASFEKQLTKSDIYKSFDRLQNHGLLCINNLVSSLEPDDLGGIDNLHNVWQGLTQLSTTHSVIQKPSKLEAVTSALRAVVQKLAELESPKLSSVTPNDLQFLFEMGQQCQQNEVRVHTIRIISTIGCLLAKKLEPHSMLKNIGMFLLEIICKDGDLWVVAEALDSLFDVFGEDHLDPVVREIHLVERLKQILGPLKAKINSTKHTLGEHYPIVSTAKTNLIRFIKYKTTHTQI